MRLVLGLFKSAGLVLRIAREASRSLLPKTQGRESLSRYHSGFSPVLVKTEKSGLRKIHQLYSGVSENVTLTEELRPCLKQQHWLCPDFEEFPWSSSRSIFRLRYWIFYCSHQCMLPSAVSVMGPLPPGKYRAGSSTFYNCSSKTVQSSSINTQNIQLSKTLRKMTGLGKRRHQSLF